MPVTKREQTLIDICFSISTMIVGYPSLKYLSREEIAEWTRKQLKDNGFPTKPAGMSWGVLKDE